MDEEGPGELYEGEEEGESGQAAGTCVGNAVSCGRMARYVEGRVCGL